MQIVEMKEKNGVFSMYKLFSSKKAMNIESSIRNILIGILGFVIIFQVLAGTVGLLFYAGDNIAATSVPLGSLFARTGAIWYALTIALVGIALGLLFKFGKGMSGK